MYKSSDYLSHRTPGILRIEIIDTCLGRIVTDVAVRQGAGVPAIVRSNFEACVIAHVYHSRGLNVGLNMAAYFIVKRSNRDLYLRDRIVLAQKNVTTSQNVINAYMPNLQYTNRYVRSINWYIQRATTFIAPKLDIW